jgi:hypothetical protein
MMTEMSFDRENRDKFKTQTAYDPCVGCGATFLPASNYVLRGYASDINGLAVKLTKIQCNWFAPWFAFSPDGLKGFDPKAEHIQLIPSDYRKAAAGQMMLELFPV